MRGKVAKALRKYARQQTEGLPDRQLVWNSPKKQFAINNPQTTRGFYRAMKAAFRRGARHVQA